MPEELLHRPDIIARFEQMGRKRVPKGMTAGRLWEVGLLDRPLHGSLSDQTMGVMAPDHPGPRVA